MRPLEAWTCGLLHGANPILENKPHMKSSAVTVTSRFVNEFGLCVVKLCAVVLNLLMKQVGSMSSDSQLGDDIGAHLLALSILTEGSLQGYQVAKAADDTAICPKYLSVMFCLGLWLSVVTWQQYEKEDQARSCMNSFTP